MPMPVSAADFLDLIRQSGILGQGALQNQERDSLLSHSPEHAAEALIRGGVLTRFQARLLLAGKHRGLRIGAYVILDQLGQGGMGAVYLAAHETLKRKVALKVLTASKDPLAVKRFEREARAAATLDHPSIVRLFDVAKHGEAPFLVMEYVEGRTMDKLLTDSGPLPYRQVAGWVFQVALGLQHAHEMGIVHRDIKPANLIVTRVGQAKILDMGLARSDEDRDKLTEMMDKGAIMGTADYISPEQALSGTCDTRSDIYSLGVTAYTLVNGRPPFGGTLNQKLFAHQMTAAPNLADVVGGVPRELADVIAKMMAKNPEERFQTPGEAAAALAPWAVMHGVSSQTVTESNFPLVLGLRAADASTAGGAILSHAPTEIAPARRVIEVRPRSASQGRQDQSGRPTRRIWIRRVVVVGTLGAIAFIAATRGSRDGLAKRQPAWLSPSPAGKTMTTSARPAVVSGKTTTLTVEVPADPGTGLTYAWSAVSLPTGAPTPTFSANGTASAKQTVATFARAGVYTLRATVTDQTGYSATSDFTVPVAQFANAVRLTPTVRDVAPGSLTRFSAGGIDQFGYPLEFTWSATAGQVNSAGLFTAPKAAQSVTVTAQGGGLTARAVVEVDPLVPFAHWRLDEGEGNTAADATGNDRTGAVTNPVWTAGAKGRPTLHFNGATSHVTFGTGPSLFGATDFTLVAWVRTNATTRGVIVQQRDKGGFNGEYQLSVAANGTVRFMLFGNGNQQFDFSTVAAVNDGRWHHVTAVRQGMTGTLYIDGASSAAAVGMVRDLNGTIGVALGADIRDNNGYFNGDLVDVRIYDTALIPAQLGALAGRTPQ